MEILRTYAKELVSIVVPLLTALITWLFRSRVRLTYSMPHGFTFLVQEPLRDAQGAVIKDTQTVWTQSYFFRNAGRATANHVEIVFNWKPKCLNIWPSRHIDETVEPDRRYVLQLATLAPGENFGCELLDVNNELPKLVTVRCDEGVGRSLTMYPQPTAAKWRVILLLLLALLGAVAAIYLVLVSLQWLVLKTPAP